MAYKLLVEDRNSDVRPLLSLLAVLLLSAVSGKPALAFSRADAAVVNKIAQRALQRYQIPGMSIAVVDDGRIVYARGYGFRDRAKRIAADAHTHYQIGSLTKQFVAAEVMMLVKRGKLSLGSTVGRVLGPGPDAAVTVRELLEQRSGIPDYNTPGMLLREASSVVPWHTSPNGIARVVMSRPLEFRPGTRFEYSNSNYLLLGLIVQRVTGDALQARIEHDLLRPIGLHSTALGSFVECTGEDACAYSKTPLGVRLVTPWSWRLTFSAGGMNSTVLDLAKWDVALMDHRAIGRQAFRAMRLPESRSGYGYGLYSYADGRRDTVVWHDGTVYGFKAMNAMVLPGDDAVIVLANADYAHAPIVAMQIERALFGIPGGGGERTDLNLPRYAYPIALTCALLPLCLLLVRRRRWVPVVLLSACAYAGGVYLWMLAPAFAAAALGVQVMNVTMRRAPR